jgi:hypothetical protein
MNNLFHPFSKKPFQCLSTGSGLLLSDKTNAIEIEPKYGSMVINQNSNIKSNRIVGYSPNYSLQKNNITPVYDSRPQIDSILSSKMNTINFNKMKPIKKVGSGIKKSNIKFII